LAFLSIKTFQKNKKAGEEDFSSRPAFLMKLFVDLFKWQTQWSLLVRILLYVFIVVQQGSVVHWPKRRSASTGSAY
jgi:hypothetical protein